VNKEGIWQGRKDGVWPGEEELRLARRRRMKSGTDMKDGTGRK
jgi:hypothetical protein